MSNINPNSFWRAGYKIQELKSPLLSTLCGNKMYSPILDMIVLELSILLKEYAYKNQKVSPQVINISRA